MLIVEAASRVLPFLGDNPGGWLVSFSGARAEVPGGQPAGVASSLRPAAR